MYYLILDSFLSLINTYILTHGFSILMGEVNVVQHSRFLPPPKDLTGRKDLSSL